MTRFGVATACVFLCALSAWAGALEEEVREGREAEAVKAGLEAFAKKPDDLALARRLQELLVVEGRAAEAEALPEKAAPAIQGYLACRLKGLEALRKMDDEGAPAFLPLDLALAWLQEGDGRKAEKAVKNYLATHPTDPEGWEVLGRAKQRLGTRKSAREAYEKALELDPGRPGAAVLLSDMFWKDGKAEAAGRVLDGALALHPKSTVIRLGRIDDHIRRGDAATAKDIAERLEKERPKDLRVLIRYAAALRAVGRYDETAKVAARILVIDPEHARALETAGFVLEKKGKHEEALDRYMAAVKADPDWAGVYVSAAFMQLRLGSVEYAEAMLERAFDLEKNHTGAHRLQGMIEYLRDEGRDAKKHLKIALKANPKDVSTLRILGYIALAEGKPKDAIEHFRKITDLAKRDAAGWRMIGRCHTELGKLQEALDALERAEGLDDADAWIHLDIGKVLEEKGEFDEAKKSFEKAIKLDPTLSWPHLYLAEILDQVDGEIEPALDHYEAFLELGGDDPDEEIARRVRQIKRS